MREGERERGRERGREGESKRGREGKERERKISPFVHIAPPLLEYLHESAHVTPRCSEVQTLAF